MPRMLLLTCLAVWTSHAAIAAAAEPSPPAAPRRVPVIDVTDLYHPHQDVGDNFDVIAAYALPEIDLRAVILDCTETFRQPVAKDPGPGLFPDPDGPSNFSIYSRGDPRENEAALREALPALYLSFRPSEAK